MKKKKECASEPSGSEIAVKAAMEAEISGEGKNGDSALTMAFPALLLCQEGREEDGKVGCKLEATMVRWHGR